MAAGKTSRIVLFVLLAVLFILFSTLITESNPYRKSIRLSGEWFLSNQNQFFLYYEYDPLAGEHLTTQHPLREMASLWSVAELSNYLNDPELRELAERGFKSFENSFLYDEEGSFYYSGITPDSVKLGYSAFILLTLLEIDPDSPYLEGFADGILSLQQEDGSFKTFFFIDRQTGQDYYPGEALFALMSLYEVTGNEKYLAAVEKAFPYYREYWDGNPNTAFAPWQSRAYYMFYKATDREDAADLVFAMSDYMLGEYRPSGNCSGFDFPGYGITSGVHIEGVIQGYGLAEMLGDTERMRCYGNYVEEGLDYLVSIQITRPGYGKPAIGGFPGSGGIMRVDRNQHAVLALMGACDAGIVYCGG